MPTSKTALQFVFSANQMKAICGPDQEILITSYLEDVITQGGVIVGAMRVKAKAKPGKPDNQSRMTASTMLSDGTIYGCPVPPCGDE